MKKLSIISLMLIATMSVKMYGQDKSINRTDNEKFGKTINLGIGIGYNGYVGHPFPFATLNYEFDIARDFTLAPFVGGYAYQDRYYWRNPDLPNNYYRYYNYTVTVVPMGVKGTYYFDRLFRAGSKWDFYAAGSLGFSYSHVIWESGYYGDTHVYKTVSPLYANAHIGAEYHINHRAGIFLDLSTGVSTFGFAFHF